MTPTLIVFFLRSVIPYQKLFSGQVFLRLFFSSCFEIKGNYYHEWMSMVMSMQIRKCNDMQDGQTIDLLLSEFICHGSDRTKTER